jgi:hypothetical protein
MTAGLSSNLDEENKQFNRELIAEHERVAARVERGEELSRLDLVLIRDANRIHLNDAHNLNGHHQEAVMLDKWLDTEEYVAGQEAEVAGVEHCGARQSGAVRMR